MAKRTNKPAGFNDRKDEPVQSSALGSDVGDSKPENRATEPERPVNGAIGFDTVSPIDLTTGGASSSGGSDDGEPRKRRPRGPNRPKETKATADIIGTVTGALIGINSCLAMLTRVPEFNIPEGDVKEVSEAVEELANHYAVTLDPKRLAQFRLGFVMLSAYGPVAAAVWRRGAKSQPKEERSRVSSIAEAPRQEPKAARTPAEVWDEAPQDDISLGTQ